jgi:uncharacterized protein (TIGR02421 family)
VILTANDLAVDRELASISESFRFLVDITPTNGDEASQLFLEDPASTPAFTYRPLEDAPDVIAARLRAVDVSSVDDQTLAHLFAAKKNELRLQVEMLAARDSNDFLPLSIELYGSVSPILERTAEEILTKVPPGRKSRGRRLGAEVVARKAQVEIDRYRDLVGDLSIAIEIRPDTVGVMVSNGNLLISESTSIAVDRLEALLAHEVQTHVLTYINGSSQQLKLLAAGLAGYEETQEGMALVAEAMVGGLGAARLHQIAARVVAVARMTAQTTFADVHRELVERWGCSPKGAFTIAMRAFRSGGLTKDAIYLRGLQDLVEYVSRGGDLDRLWVGKFSLSELPLIEELRERAMLVRPPLRPRFLDDPGAVSRLEVLARNEGVTGSDPFSSTLTRLVMV